MCFWRNDYRSVLILQNLPCLEKFLVARLHWEITLKKFVSQTKGKCDSLVLSRSYLSMEWRFHVIPRVHCCHFCLEPTVKREAWLRTTFVTVMVILFERNILKVTWSQLCSNFFSKFTRNIGNSILKDTLQLNNSRTWINIRAESFIKTSVKIMKQNSMKVPGTSHQKRPRFTYFIRFFFSQI